MGKGDALGQSNYRGRKLTEQALKGVERTADSPIRQIMSIDDSQFGFIPDRGLTVVQQLQEKYHSAGKGLYMAFVDLEKAFD